MAIKASELDYKDVAAYLVDGVTWGRLKAIATHAPEDGGLGLFTDGSRKCKEIFSAGPSAIMRAWIACWVGANAARKSRSPSGMPSRVPE